MTKVRFVNGKVLFNYASVVIRDDACCCQEVPCSCTVLKSGPCKCVNAAYGDDRDVPDVVVTIGGTAPFFVPSFSCIPTINTACGDPRGTYLLSCGDTLQFCWEYEWCAGSWQRIVIDLLYDKRSVFVGLTSGGGRCGGSVSQNGGFWRWNLTIVEDWLYTPSEVCREECNFFTDNAICADQLDWTFDDTTGAYVASAGTCDISGLTVSLSAA